MIVHKIITTPEPRPVHHIQQIPRHTQRMGKLEYNAFLARTKINKGDYLINAYVDPAIYGSVIRASIFKVAEIQEMHQLVEYEFNGNIDTPKCFLVTNDTGAAFWTPPHRWVKCPQEILDRFGIDYTQNCNC